MSKQFFNKALLGFSLLILIGLNIGFVIAQAIDEVVLVVDSQAVTAKEFSVLRLIQDQSKKYSVAKPKLGEPVTDAIVNDLIFTGHAKRLAAGLQITEAQVDSAITDLAQRNNIAAEQLVNDLRQQGVDILIFRASLKQQLLVQQVIGQRIASGVKVSPNEISEYINNRPELRSQQQKKFLASHLVVPIKEGASQTEIKNLRDIALNLRKKIKAGEAFESVLQASAEAQSSNESGSLGWKKQDELPALFVDVLLKLKAGEVSSLIESSNGFHVLALHKVESSNALAKEFQIRHILKVVAPNVDASAAAAQLQNLKSQILVGIDFASVAQAESQDTGSAENGGLLGWVRLQQLEPQFGQAVLALEVGQLSEPIRTQFGVHLVQVLGQRDIAGASSLEARVEQQIFSEKVNEKMQDLLNDLKQVVLVEVVN